MVAALPVPVVVLSSAYTAAYANRAFRQHFGLSAEELRRVSIGQIFPGTEIEQRIRASHDSATPVEPLIAEVKGTKYRISMVPSRNWDDESELETLLVIENLGAAEPPEP